MVIGNLGATTHGATMVYPAPSFDPEATLAAVAAERCTCLYGVPMMFIAELAVPDFDSYDLSSLRTGAMGGSPCPVEVMKQVVERVGMTEVTIVDGMTETSPVSTQTCADDSLQRRVSTVGRVHPHVEIKIIDLATGMTVPRGEPGELCTRDYSVMLGYWNQPDKTAEAIDAARWMHTGDLATMDDAGYVNITALRADRRGFPDDCQREGAQGRDARRFDRAARARRSGRDRTRLIHGTSPGIVRCTIG